MASLAGIVRALEDGAIVLLETRDSDERPAEAAARLLALALQYRAEKDAARRSPAEETTAEAPADLQPVEGVDADRAREEPAPRRRPTRRQKADASAAGIAAQAAAEGAGAPPDAETVLGYLRTHPIKEARI